MIKELNINQKSIVMVGATASEACSIGRGVGLRRFSLSPLSIIYDEAVVRKLCFEYAIGIWEKIVSMIRYADDNTVAASSQIGFSLWFLCAILNWASGFSAHAKIGNFIIIFIIIRKEYKCRRMGNIRLRRNKIIVSQNGV